MAKKEDKVDFNGSENRDENGMAKPTEAFGETSESRTWIFTTVKEEILDASDAAFEKLGFEPAGPHAGEYSDEKTYGHGAHAGMYSVKLASKSNTYLEKIITLGGKRMISIITMHFNVASKTLSLDYSATENALFRGFQDKSGPLMLNFGTTISASSKDGFKKMLKKILKPICEKEAAYLTSTKLGAEDAIGKNSDGVTTENEKESLKENIMMSMKDLMSSNSGTITKLFEGISQNAPEVKKKNTISAEDGGEKFIMLDAEDEEEYLISIKVLKPLRGNLPDYKGTIKKEFYRPGKAGWFLYDEDDNQEDSGPFSNLKALMDYFNIAEGDLSGDYAEHLEEISTAGSATASGGGGAMGTAGQFKYDANPFKNKSDSFWGQPKKRMKEAKTSYTENVPLVKGTGYLPKGMEHNYVQGMHESTEEMFEIADDPTKKLRRKFVSDSDNESQKVNKRYIITEKFTKEEEKNRWSELALFEAYDTISPEDGPCNLNECSCGCGCGSGSEETSREDYENEMNQEFENTQKIDDIENIGDGEEIDGRAVVVIAKPESEAVHKFFEDDYMNESKMYIVDLVTNQLVANPGYQGSGRRDLKYLQEQRIQKPKKYSLTSLQDENDIPTRFKKLDLRKSWQTGEV